MTTKTSTALKAHPGPASKTPDWYEARRGGATATEIRDLAKGYKSNRNRILREKLTGDRMNLAGKPAVEYGNLREPLIAAWIERRFGIPANDLLYIHDDDHRLLATPDGLEVDPMTGDVYVSEVKTSKHDLTPGRIDDEHVLRLTKGPGGKWYLQDNHFADTGYYDQMQIQMFVTGATRTLFAWEQHDGDWTEWPERAPRTLTPEPGWCWVLRDEKRIAELLEVAYAFLAEVVKKRLALEMGDSAVLPELSAEEEEAIALEKRTQDVKHQRARELAEELVVYRRAESQAKADKERVWKELQDLLEGETDWLDESEHSPRISVVTSVPTRKVVNREKMLEKAPTLVERYEKLVERYTETVTEAPKTTLTVTTPKGK